jgi:hypothetical protein
LSAYDTFRRRKFRILGVLVAAFVAFALGAWLHDRVPSSWQRIMMLAFILILFVHISLYAFAFHCPRCHRRINAANTADDGYISFPNYCAHCGVDFMSVDIHNKPI